MLKKGVLGWQKVAGLGVSLVIAGQFSGWNYGLVGNGWANMLIATLLMAVLCTSLALCITELSIAKPHAGGVFAYTQLAFGPFVGYMVGAACALALSIGTAVAASFVASYIESVFGVGGWPVLLAVFCVIIGIHIYGVGEALGLTMVAGLVAVIALLAFSAIMMPHVKWDNLVLTQTAETATGISLGGIFASVPFAIWMFICLEQVSSAAEESDNPRKAMPRGVLGAAATLLVTGLLIVISAPGAAGVDVVGPAADPLYAAMTHVGLYGKRDWLPLLVASGAVCGLLATFFSIVFSASRQLFALSRDGYLPSMLAKTNKRGSPHIALLALMVIGLPLTQVSPDKLLLCIVLILTTCHMFLFAAYLKLRGKGIEKDSFHIKGGVFFAVIGAALTLIVICACSQLDIALLSSLAAMVVLIAINYLVRTSRPAKSLEKSENV